ncbi:MAG TPA: hypothetical protein VFH73_00355 [Polyangia bacterium]|jgi:hypothetical protein|nr:hypothetical protein [Polyangia bacterium]
MTGRAGRLTLATLIGVGLLSCAITAVAAEKPLADQPLASRPPAGKLLALAIVVGSNKSASPAAENLRFGDDDAVQNARTFEMLGVRTTLLASLDAETRELFPKARPQGPATRAALRAAFERAADTLAEAQEAGRPTRLYFLFAGHGEIADGRPFLQLDDGRLWREDLAEMLRDAEADDNHVLVDACYGASFVADRGPGGERIRVPPGFSQRAGAVWPRRTGFLTARSSGGQTHEWAEFQAGVFSHELRSGLVGAADVNLDGIVSYREIAAFVRRANEAVPNLRYRPQVSTTPPDGNLDAALATLPSGPLVLEMDQGTSGHTFVETETGIRLVDLHAAAGTPIHLRLPIDLGRLYVQQASGGSRTAPRQPPREFRLTGRSGRVQLSSLMAETPRVRARGAAHEAFLLLFAKPFDGTAVAAFRLDPVDSAEGRDAAPPGHGVRRTLTIGAFGLGVASAAVAGGLAWSAIKLHDSTPPGASNAQATATTRDIHNRNVAAGVLAGVAGASLVTGLALALWPTAPAVVMVSYDAFPSLTFLKTF